MVTIPEDSRYGLGEVCGTPCYIAPEVLRHKGYREKADLFSIGSVFFNLLTGMYLFKGLENEVLLAEVIIFHKNQAFSKFLVKSNNY